ncbi:hypothetical protein [Actinomycetospora sp. NBRC 106375]|uniref:hypothetical protein n=1 Tax=Actinomycetospora sp. NBRC 106375 TaxID=3032207 RepID=UPI002553B464|nr:hypothetical protein [Actinomycetospora sp. NBRC 106375]
MGAPGPRGPARRAAALTRLLAPWRWTVAAWAGGYTVTGPTGALAPAGSLDEVVERAWAARPQCLRERWEDTAPAQELGLADAVVRASVAALYREHLVLTGPEPHGRRSLVVHGDVSVDVVPRPGTGWTLD